MNCIPYADDERCLQPCLWRRDRLKGTTTFRQNSALWGAGIFSREGGNEVPMIVYSEDTIFEGNVGGVRLCRLDT